MRFFTCLLMMTLAVLHAHVYAADSLCFGTVSKGSMEDGVKLPASGPNFAAPRGAYLRQHPRFMAGKAWVRHDEHYHVDFAVRCKPYKG